ncbi:uncharacterized protein LOC141856176 [Brevipalpus obovatus]|uniref:uncharacterized protein LOC141855784 n=1 Tax=Brevipalpus obovatus TaxID=246614 RepID=UPI003D9EAFA5
MKILIAMICFSSCILIGSGLDEAIERSVPGANGKCHPKSDLIRKLKAQMDQCIEKNAGSQGPEAELKKCVQKFKFVGTVEDEVKYCWKNIDIYYNWVCCLDSLFLAHKITDKNKQLRECLKEFSPKVKEIRDIL